MVAAKLSQSAKALGKFLRDNGIGPVEAGRALDVTHVTVIGWATGKRTPSDANKRRIRVWTDGAVQESGWRAGRARKEVTPFARDPEAA
jgi:hypothetical protein